MDRMIGPRLHNSYQFGLLRRVSRRGLGRARSSFRPSGPWSLKRWTQSRSVWRSIPPILAASVRFIASSTAASDKSRRLRFACREAAASRRRSQRRPFSRDR